MEVRTVTFSAEGGTSLFVPLLLLLSLFCKPRLPRQDSLITEGKTGPIVVRASRGIVKKQGCATIRHSPQ